MSERKYEFSWGLLGDISEGRPNLGDMVGLAVYRLMQFTLRDVLERKLGSEKTDEVFFEAGKIAGTEFYNHFVAPVSDLNEFVNKTQKALKDQNIGILRIEEVMLDQGKIILTVDEDLDCSGLPELEYEVCIYDEGFIAGLFESFSNKPWSVKEIDCWCTGARTCRFLATEGK